MTEHNHDPEDYLTNIIALGDQRQERRELESFLGELIKFSDQDLVIYGD